MGRNVARFRRAMLASAASLAWTALLVGGQAAATEFKVLHSFGGGHDGGGPYTAVVADKTGALYGTTYQGGSSGLGTAFKLSPPTTGHISWDEQILHSFSGSDAGPIVGLVFDGSGNLYGAADIVGTLGSVFELMPPAPGHTVWGHKVLYKFHDSFDGADPAFGALILDAEGNLFGSGYDVAYRLSPPTIGETAWHLTDLVRLRYLAYGSLLLDSAGNLYRTTEGGPDWNGDDCGRDAHY